MEYACRFREFDERAERPVNADDALNTNAPYAPFALPPSVAPSRSIKSKASASGGNFLKRRPVSDSTSSSPPRRARVQRRARAASQPAARYATMAIFFIAGMMYAS